MARPLKADAIYAPKPDHWYVLNGSQAYHEYTAKGYRPKEGPDARGVVTLVKEAKK